MDKVLYCADSSRKRKSLKKILPSSFRLKCTSKVSDIDKEKSPLLVFEEQFLKKRKSLELSRLSDKVAIVYLSGDGKSASAAMKRFHFFDYFTGEESKTSIRFKLKRAKEFAGLKKRISSLEAGNLKKDKRIEEIILVDPLSKCYNWRYFLRHARQELARARRHLYHLSFIAVDIDYFRQINELYTVKAADFIVKSIVAIIRKNLRKDDIITRWKDDEFFIVLPYMLGEDAYQAAKRIKNEISSYRFKHKNLVISIKVSLGVVSFPDDKVLSTKEVIYALNSCLAAAKRKGGDTVARYSRRRPGIVYYGKKKKKSIEELSQKIQKLNTLLTRDLLEMIYGFARTIEAKDHYTGEHVEYTAFIAERIAAKLKLSKNDIENIKRAAFLHDLGKVGIAQSILSKKGPLTEEERKVIRSHSWIAAEILRGIHALRGVIPAILHHHERYNGKGYPLGLKGEEIPLAARIVAIADVYQALISDRPYRNAFSRKEAVRIIRNESGKYFDPKIVKIFLKVIGKKP